MIAETYFDLSEYEQNYDRLKNEFVDSYIDNDVESFNDLQIEWYEKCLKNTELEWTVNFDGDIGWFPKVFSNDGVVVWEVIEKIKNKNGGMNPTVAQNLSVSFCKILKFLKNIPNKPSGEFTAARVMLYHFVLQEAKLAPPFPHRGKGKALKDLSLQYGVSSDNLKKKFNVIMPSDGKSGYGIEDAKMVREYIMNNNPSALPTFENMTKHIFI